MQLSTLDSYNLSSLWSFTVSTIKLALHIVAFLFALLILIIQFTLVPVTPQWNKKIQIYSQSEILGVYNQTKIFQHLILKCYVHN